MNEHAAMLPIKATMNSTPPTIPAGASRPTAAEEDSSDVTGAATAFCAIIAHTRTNVTPY